MLERDQMSLCDLIEQEKSLLIDEKCVRHEFRARCSGYKWFQSNTLHFVPPRPAPTPQFNSIVRTSHAARAIYIYIPNHDQKETISIEILEVFVINFTQVIHTQHSDPRQQAIPCYRTQRYIDRPAARTYTYTIQEHVYMAPQEE